jgi:hypothetical protein
MSEKTSFKVEQANGSDKTSIAIYNEDGLVKKVPVAIYTERAVALIEAAKEKLRQRDQAAVAG